MPENELWRLRQGKSVEVPVKQFDNDFRVMIGQLADEAGCEPETLIVRGMPIDAFSKWAKNLEPDWDRYLGVTAFDLHERGLIDESLYESYDTPGGVKKLEAKMKELGLPGPYEYGLEVYVDALAEAIRLGEPIPPLLTLEGDPADGRHRTLAAMKLGRNVVPVAEVTEDCIE